MKVTALFLCRLRLVSVQPQLNFLSADLHNNKVTPDLHSFGLDLPEFCGQNDSFVQLDKLTIHDS